jgi:hypothetical protein
LPRQDDAGYCRPSLNRPILTGREHRGC